MPPSSKKNLGQNSPQGPAPSPARGATTSPGHRSAGGARPGAGRPRGQGKYGEPTIPLRIPQSCRNAVVSFVAKLVDNGSPEGLHRPQALPLYACKVSAGFPSPADDFLEGKLDLNQHLVHHPAATFFVRATGDSMKNAGIYPDDILIVDRSLTPKNNSIVIAVVNGELTVKRLHKTATHVVLQPENPAYEPIVITPEHDFHIWGVVTNVIHNLA